MYFSCSEAPRVIISPSERIVLAELFTWARCPNCPFATQALDSLKKEYPDSLIVIAYHRRVLGDTLSPQYVENRKAFYYTSGGEPAVLFDGTGPVWTTDPPQNYQTYKTHIINRRNQKSPLKIKLEPQTGIIKATIIATDVINATNLRLFFIICEDSIRFSLSGAYDSVFNHVMRAIIPNENGIACALTLGDSLNQEVSFTLMPGWNRTQLKVISFVQDMTTKEILQSAVKKLEQNVAQYNFNLLCLTDTFQTVAANGVSNFNFRLTNTGSVNDVYKITCQNLESVPGWSSSFCIKGSCFLPGDTVLDTLAVGQIDSTIHISVYTTSTTGRAVLSVNVRSLGDPTKQGSIRVYTQVGQKTKARDKHQKFIGYINPAKSDEGS